MNKKYLLIVMLVLSVVCVGCKNKENVSNEVSGDNDINATVSGEQYNFDSIEMREEANKVIINMYDDLTTEYIVSGDFIVEKNDIYHFESEEKAEDFANSLDVMLEGAEKIIDGKNVIIKSDYSLSPSLTKKDLMDTYLILKEEYENEKK